MINKLLLPAGLLIISGVLFITGLLAQNPEAFLFPNFISGTLCVIALVTLINSIRRQGDETEEIKPIPWLVILPALVIFILYLGLVERIGFYVTSFTAFMAIVLIYIPDRFSVAHSLKIFLTGIAFMVALYSLFTILLKVQLPRGLFF